MHHALTQSTRLTQSYVANATTHWAINATPYGLSQSTIKMFLQITPSTETDCDKDNNIRIPAAAPAGSTAIIAQDGILMEPWDKFGHRTKP
jgi:hypothetical protein